MGTGAASLRGALRRSRPSTPSSRVNRPRVMPSISLFLVIHDHQPVGNFDGVFRQAYEDAYDPFLAFLERHPRLRIALHTSGPLLQWIGLHARDYLGRLRQLVERGQVELWGGGFFEPVLP